MPLNGTFQLPGDVCLSATDKCRSSEHFEHVVDAFFVLRSQLIEIERAYRKFVSSYPKTSSFTERAIFVSYFFRQALFSTGTYF